MTCGSPLSDATHLTLGVTGFSDALEKLRWEIRRFKESADRTIELGSAHEELQARIPMWDAANAAATAWSLLEWAYREVEGDVHKERSLCELLGVPADSQPSVLKNACRKVPELNACHQISHAVKHARLSRMTAGLSARPAFRFDTTSQMIGIKVSGIISEEGGELRSATTLVSVLDNAERWWSHAGKTIGL